MKFSIREPKTIARFFFLSSGQNAITKKTLIATSDHHFSVSYSRTNTAPLACRPLLHRLSSTFMASRVPSSMAATWAFVRRFRGCRGYPPYP